MKTLITIFVLELAVFCADARAATYSTTFALTENPISEGGRWINGLAVGLDWQNVRTTPGLAFGADASGNPNYNDPTALLNGTWGPNQTVQATVYSVNQQSGNIYEEVELRLRSTITAHVNSGYEVLFRCNHAGDWYTDIVRWNGPLGNWTSLSHITSGPGIFNGDVVKATMIGNVIRVYINGVQVNQATDNTYANGNPGMGFYLHNIAGRNADFGFTSFSASDVTAPAAPTNLRIVPASDLAAMMSSTSSQSLAPSRLLNGVPKTAAPVRVSSVAVVSRRSARRL